MRECDHFSALGILCVVITREQLIGARRSFAFVVEVEFMYIGEVGVVAEKRFRFLLAGVRRRRKRVELIAFRVVLADTGSLREVEIIGLVEQVPRIAAI